MFVFRVRADSHTPLPLSASKRRLLSPILVPTN